MAWTSDSNRRQFLQTLASMPAVAGWSTAAVTPLVADSLWPAFAYVGSHDRIDVFDVAKSRWTLKQSVPSRRPASLVLRSDQRILFALNEVDEYLGLPTGSVESYAIAPESGTLSLVGRQGLSLSATAPQHLAVAPNGQYLVVAAYGGGAYNWLPISGAGKLGPVTQVVKEIGRGAHRVRQASAHPHSIAVHPSGRFLISTDFGSDRVNVFATEGGVAKRVCRVAVQPGDGPAHLVPHPSGSLFFISNELNRSVASYQFDASTGQIIDPSTRILGACGALAIHPSGNFLYSTHPSCSETIAGWTINRESGALTLAQSTKIGPHSSLLLSRGGESLFAFGHKEACSMMRMEVKPSTGHIGQPVQLTKGPPLLCLALLYS